MPIVTEDGVTIPAYADPADVPAAMRAMSESLMPRAGGTFIGLVDMGGNRISGIAPPTSNDDASTKQYVDGKVGSVVWNTLPGKPTVFPPDDNTGAHPHAAAPKWTTRRKLTLAGDATGSVWVQGHEDMAMTVTVVGGTAHAHSQYVEVADANYLRLTGGTLTGGLTINGGGINVEGQATFRANMLGPGTDTTSGSLPAWKVGSGAEFLRQTSSRRFKKDIVDADPSYIERLLALRPVNYKSRIERDGESTYIGLIAEEVFETAPEFTFADAETGTVDAVAYEGLIVPLLMAVQWLAAKVKTLEAKVAT